jgi:Ankyrin repeats (many copies)
MSKSRFSRSGPLLLQSVLLLIGARPVMSQSPPANDQLIKELPACSVLREELERGVHGNGVDQPYMAKMRAQGVRRVQFNLTAVFRNKRAEGAQVVRRLYFRQFDGPDAQITDEATIQAIAHSGLAEMLDDLAINRVAAAPRFLGDGHPRGNQVSSLVEFFSDAWLPEQRVWLFPTGHASTHPSSLVGAVVDGDVLDSRALLQAKNFSKKELDRALFDAVLSRYDNTTVIDLLLNAGADVNSRTPDGWTPLMSAVSHPCNLHPLLDRGADLNARDKWGKNALQVAREQKVVTSIRLLEEADAKGHG